MLVVGVEVTVAALLLVIVAAAALFHFCMNIRKKYHTRSILQARVANKKAKNGKIRKLEQGKNRSKWNAWDAAEEATDMHLYSCTVGRGVDVCVRLASDSLLIFKLYHLSTLSWEAVGG